MTDEQNQDLAAQIAESIRQSAPHAEVRINPTIQAIPANIASNILELLRRVQVTGMEALAWAEAYQYVQQFSPQTGVQFPGLPQQKK